MVRGMSICLSCGRLASGSMFGRYCRRWSARRLIGAWRADLAPLQIAHYFFAELAVTLGLPQLAFFLAFAVFFLTLLFPFLVTLVSPFLQNKPGYQQEEDG